jgi:hypothetical protein
VRFGIAKVVRENQKTALYSVLVAYTKFYPTVDANCVCRRMFGFIRSRLGSVLTAESRRPEAPLREPIERVVEDDPDQVPIFGEQAQSSESLSSGSPYIQLERRGAHPASLNTGGDEHDATVANVADIVTIQ